MSLLQTGRHPMTMFTMSLSTKHPMPCSCWSSFPLKKTLRSSPVVVSPKFFHLVSQSPRMFHLYLVLSCVSSLSFPSAVSLLVFHVPMVMLSLPPILDGASVACFPPPSWCTVQGAVFVDSGGDRSGIICCHFMVTQRQSTIWRSPSLSTSSTWPLSSSRNPFAHLALVFEVWRHPPSDVMLLPAISPITGRLEHGGRVLISESEKWTGKKSSSKHLRLYSNLLQALKGESFTVLGFQRRP